MTDTFLPEITVEHPGLYEDEWFDLRGNGDSYLLARWFPADEQGTPTQPKAVIVFVHGFAEHMGRYRNIFKLFVDRGYEINGFDQRGFGRTSYESENRSKMHGRTTWADQLSDVERMIRLARKRADARWGKDKVPLFLMGHSMGGGISLAFFTREAGSGPSEETMAMVSGVMLSSPWLDIHFPIPTTYAVPVLECVLSWLPELKVQLGPPTNNLCRDPLVCESARMDPLCSSYVYARCLLDPLRGGPRMVASEFRNWPEHLPLLVCHGTGDKVTQWACSDRLCKNLTEIGRQATLRTFDGFYHEGLHEPGEDKIRYANAYIDWLDERVAHP